ncbi:MAG: hypothetical protein ACRDHP_09725, partial [Ktedonobacterales bacterium]
RFFKALTRDLLQDQSGQRPDARVTPGVRDINEFRSRREHARVQRVRIEPAEPEPQQPDSGGSKPASTPPSDAGAE